MTKSRLNQSGSAGKQNRSLAEGTGSADADEQMSRGRAQYGQVGGERETAKDEGGVSRQGHQGGFGEEKPEAKAARRRDAIKRRQG